MKQYTAKELKDMDLKDIKEYFDQMHKETPRTY